jgi:hypothetical protein
MPDTVDLVLDLRRAQRVPKTAADFLGLWADLEERLRGASLQGSACWEVDAPRWGTCGLLLTEPAAAPGLVTDETMFVVRSVLEPSQVHYQCASCAERGTTEYGPFTCEQCKSEGTAERVCDSHAVILDGSFRATCPRHAPECSECGVRATFWCWGPGCQKKQAHCDAHRRYHPGDQAISYCLACYDVRFPECGHVGCRNTGSLACEYVAQEGLRPCDARACSLHAFWWQVFGPHRRSPVLCLDHQRALPRFSREHLAFEIVATSCGRDSIRASRRDGTQQRGGPVLPRLSSVRHIFINTRGEAPSLAMLNSLFTQLQNGLQASGAEGRLRRALERQAASREQEVAEERRDRIRGEELFARLQQILAGQGKHGLASRISLSYFRQRSSLLWVRVPEDLKGAFIGEHHRNVNRLSELLGVTVRVEKR